MKTTLTGLILAAGIAHAGLITNGTFESGLTGWATQNQVGSDGSFLLQTGTTSPINGFTVAAPPQGTRAAMTDAQGPGSHVIYQDFLVPASLPNAIFAFSYFLNNGADQYSNLQTLDFSTPTLNQQARVDIIKPSANVFSLVAADIVRSLFATGAATPLNTGTYLTSQVDITAALQPYLGQTLRLRVSETDNVNVLNFGVDSIDITVSTVPEPSTFALAGLLLLCLATGKVRESAKRRNRSRQS